jgi:UDP:flavonoid glycosyltransferase YjiC (YdhE family)
MEKPRPRVIISPLNWGLGHAARCIPIIKGLIDAGFEPVLAGDGESLELIAAEYPSLRMHKLPSYDIRYSRHSSFFKLKLISQGPKILKSIARENQMTEEIVAKENAVGIISDNRFGVRSKKVPSVYLTHQLCVKAGWMTPVATQWHHTMISKFDHCWVCDHYGEQSLAGELSANRKGLTNVQWIGPLSRFSPGAVEKEIDVSVILSGPEPSRTEFEARVMEELKGTELKVVLVRGLVEGAQTHVQEGNFKVHNYLLSEDLEVLIKKSRMVIGRSGYSSIMDLNAIGARALLVPTPGQTEQEYLSGYLRSKGVCLTVKQRSFTQNSLKEAERYPGFEAKKTSKGKPLAPLFDVFLNESK